MSSAASNNASCKIELERAGYDVQTTRIITNNFCDYMDLSALQEDVALLKQAVPADTLINIGAVTRSCKSHADAIAALPGMLARHNVSASVHIDVDEHGVADAVMAAACAGVMRELADSTPRGEGNFNFCGAASPHGRLGSCPFFPGGCLVAAGVDDGNHCAVGLQFPDVIVNTLKLMACSNGSIVSSNAERGAAWAKACDAIGAVLSDHMQRIAAVVARAGRERGFPLRGIDGSLAPLPTAASIAEIYKLLGVPFFGAAGTLEASAFLTHVLKGVKVQIPNHEAAESSGAGAAAFDAAAAHGVVDVPLIGYTGLMLPPTEDVGLAAAASEGRYGIRDLLQYSAVCGIGLDTVPVPGDVSVRTLTSLLCDVTALAYRLNKPLSVRLFPVPGLKAGDMTAFENPNLCNTKVFDVL